MTTGVPKSTAIVSVPLTNVATVAARSSEDHSPPLLEPYIPAATTIRELTVLPVVVGAVLGVILAHPPCIWF
jgi:hypothetical protein